MWVGRTLSTLIGVYDRSEDIVFDDLPDKFILKSTQGSGEDFPYLASGIIMFIIGIFIKIPIQNVLLEMIFKILLSGIVFLLSLTIIDLLFKNKFEYVINLSYIGNKILNWEGDN